MNTEHLQGKCQIQESQGVQNDTPQKALPDKVCFRTGEWTKEEHLKYVLFIELNKSRMRLKVHRKSEKFFKRMAEFILTRNPLQCRSHHQKLEMRYKYPYRIIETFRSEFGSEKYDQQIKLHKALYFPNDDAQNNRETTANQQTIQPASPPETLHSNTLYPFNMVQAHSYQPWPESVLYQQYMPSLTFPMNAFYWNTQPSSMTQPWFYLMPAWPK